MKFLDVASSPRIALLMEMLGSIWRSADPQRAIELLLGDLRHGEARAYAEIHLTDNNGYLIRRLRCDNGESLLSADETARGGRAGQGGFLAQVARTPLPKIVHELNLADDPALPAPMASYASAMALPLFTDAAAHDWVVLFDRRRNGFAVQEMEEMIVCTSLVRTVAENLRIARQLFDANLKIQEEIAEIAAIQRALLPANVPDVPGLELASSYNTAGQAGGDIYDFVPLGSGDEIRWALLIGDVSGHGLGAAVVMAMLHAILHAYPHPPAGPAELLRHANRHLCDKQIGRTFVTAFLAFYDPRTRRLTYARAGHNPPLLVSPATPPGRSYLDAVGDLPLGITPEALYEQAEMQLQTGQTLVLYTDGITEAKNSQGEFFDTRGLESAVLGGKGDPRSVLDRINSALHRHTGSFYATDDQTLVAARVV